MLKRLVEFLGILGVIYVSGMPEYGLMVAAFLLLLAVTAVMNMRRG